MTGNGKRWHDETLRALGVARGADGRWVIPTATGPLRYADDGRQPKMVAERGAERELWPDPADVPGDVLVVVEGEPDAISATDLGYAAVALPGAGKVGEDWPQRLAQGRRRVVFVCDADSVGRARMRAMSEKVAPHAEAVMIDPAPHRDDGYDLGDMVRELGGDRAREQLDDAIDFAVPVEPEAPPQSAPTRVQWTTLDTIEPKPVKWLWRPYLPLGKVVLVAGAPGHGKSQLTAMLAADVTRGGFYDSDLDGPGRVVIVSAEDDLADTVVPRLLAAGADVRCVETVNVRQEWPGGLTTEGLIALPGDVEALHERLRLRDVRLVVFDPVASFVDRSHSTLVNQDVRSVLDPLKAMANAYATTIVCILHLNKTSEVREWSARIAESHGFQAVARSVLALGPDPDDDEGQRGAKKILALPKSNLVVHGEHSLRMAIEPATVYDRHGNPVETSRIVAKGPCDVAADDLLLSDDQRRDFMAAREWIEEYLGNGWKRSGDLKRDSSRDGHSWRTIQRVRSDICKTAKSAGSAHGAWWVALKTTTTPPPEGPGLGGIGALDADGTPKDAKTAETHSPNGALDPKDRQERQVIDLDEFRRWEQRRLGEREDD